VRFPIQVNGFENQNLSVEVEGVLSNPRLLINGKHAEGDKGGPYLLQKEDGTQVPAEFRSLNWLDPLPRLVIEDVVIPYAPAIHWAWWLLAALPIPIVLRVVDVGAVPALWGGAIALLNGRILRMENPLWARVLMILGTIIVGTAIPYIIFHYLAKPS
jgi:uncharacterized membrane protein YwzB